MREGRGGGGGGGGRNEESEGDDNEKIEGVTKKKRMIVTEREGVEGKRKREIPREKPGNELG